MGASCTGTIIHENWVVTAAHCVSQPGHRISVVAGDIWRVDQGRQRSQNRREYVASRVFLHPGYEGRDPGREKQIPDYFDIALLHFEGGIVFSNSVGAIRYRPGNGQREPYLPRAEQMCTIMGWGKTEFKLPPADHNYSKGKQRTPADRLKYADDMPVAMISETESKTVNGRRYHSRTIKVHRGDDGKREPEKRKGSVRGAARTTKVRRTRSATIRSELVQQHQRALGVDERNNQRRGQATGVETEAENPGKYECMASVLRNRNPWSRRNYNPFDL